MLTGGKVSPRHTSTMCWRSTSSNTRKRSRRHTPEKLETFFKKEGGNGMILKLSLTVLLLYYLGVLCSHYRTRHRRDARDSGDGRRHGRTGRAGKTWASRTRSSEKAPTSPLRSGGRGRQAAELWTKLPAEDAGFSLRHERRRTRWRRTDEPCGRDAGGHPEPEEDEELGAYYRRQEFRKREEELGR